MVGWWKGEWWRGWMDGGVVGLMVGWWKGGWWRGWLEDGWRVEWGMVAWLDGEMVRWLNGEWCES